LSENDKNEHNVHRLLKICSVAVVDCEDTVDYKGVYHVDHVHFLLAFGVWVDDDYSLMDGVGDVD